MPVLEVLTHDDAEVFVLDAALSRVARSVGGFRQRLRRGLYKIRVSRAGTLQEQLVELRGEDQQHRIFIDRFSAIAPIGPMLADAGGVERLAREAIDGLAGSGPGLLVLARQGVGGPDPRRPFRGARIFPWRATRQAVRLDAGPVYTAAIGGELWAARAVEVNPGDGPLVLEFKHGQQLARQSVLVAPDWQTRIFLRANDDSRQAPRERVAHTGTAQFDVSIQMAPPGADVVYMDRSATVEVAKSALERGRAIFTSERLVEELLYSKFDNPIAGITGLHLFLDAKARADAGDAEYRLARGARRLRRNEQEIADDVLINLTRLLDPARAAAAQRHEKSEAGLRRMLLDADPDWPESSDLTALRLRAGRCRGQVVVPSPPMFRVSWDVLKANASRDGKVWIGRELWSGTGAAGSAGPYLAWARGRHSVKRTLEHIQSQSVAWPGSDGGLGWKQDNAEAPGVVTERFRSRKISYPFEHAAWDRDPGRQDESAREQARLAADFGLPLSILQKAPDKAR